MFNLNYFYLPPIIFWPYREVQPTDNYLNKVFIYSSIQLGQEGFQKEKLDAIKVFRKPSGWGLSSPALLDEGGR